MSSKWKSQCSSSPLLTTLWNQHQLSSVYTKRTRSTQFNADSMISSDSIPHWNKSTSTKVSRYLPCPKKLLVTPHTSFTMTPLSKRGDRNWRASSDYSLHMTQSDWISSFNASSLSHLSMKTCQTPISIVSSNLSARDCQMWVDYHSTWTH